MMSVENKLAAIRNSAAALDVETLRVECDELIDIIEKQLVINPAQFFTALQSSLNSFDDSNTQILCDSFIKALRRDANAQLLEISSSVLKALQRKRKFTLMLQIADVILQIDENQLLVKRLYAQALIEEKRLVAAIAVLNQLQSSCSSAQHADELSESQGLLGRAWKQIYIDAAATGNVQTPQRTALKNAIRYYSDEFEQEPDQRLWHGINAVALRHRAIRDGIDLPTQNADGTLSAILQSIDRRMRDTSDNTDQQVPEQTLDMWSQATAAEACIADDQYDKALQWIAHYVDSQHPVQHSDAFELASTLRQFEEVWQLSDDRPAERKILEVLRAALLRREGGSVSVTDPGSQSNAVEEMLSNPSFEKVLGAERYKNLRWYQAGLNCASCVCRIENSLGSGLGTGFIVSSASVGLSCTHEFVVITNAHVVSSNLKEQQGTPSALPPEDAFIRFEQGLERDRVYRVLEILATSSRFELDFSVLALADLDKVLNTYSIAQRLPAADSKQRIYVIGHPKGGELSFSLHDNLLLDSEVPKLHYRAPTEGGSSGSPVFNENWELIGLHHAGARNMRRLNAKPGRYPANEGIWIQSIINQIKKS